MLLSQHDAQKALGARGRQGKKLRSRDHAVARDTNASLGCRCPGCGCRWCATGNRGEYKQRSLPLVADTVSVVNATPARGLVASPLPLPPRVARAVASALAARLALAQRLSESPWHAWRSSVSAGSMIITGGMRSAPVIHQPAVLPGLRPGNKVTCKIRSMPALQELYLEAAEAAPLRTTSAAAAATNAQQQLQRATYTLLTDGAWTPEGECTWGAVAAAPAAVAASPAAADTAAADAPSALPGAAGEDTGDELLDDEGFVLIEGPGLDLPLRIAAASATAVPEPPVLEMFPMPAAVPRTSQATITYNDFINDPQKEGAPADADADADADAAGLSCFARPPPLVIDLAALLQQAQSRPPRHRAKKDKARRIRVVAGQVQTALSADAEGYVLVDATRATTPRRLRRRSPRRPSWTRRPGRTARGCALRACACASCCWTPRAVQPRGRRTPRTSTALPSSTTCRQSTSLSTGAWSRAQAARPCAPTTSTACTRCTCRPARVTTLRSAPCGRSAVGWTLRAARGGTRGLRSRAWTARRPSCGSSSCTTSSLLQCCTRTRGDGVAAGVTACGFVCHRWFLVVLGFRVAHSPGVLRHVALQGAGMYV